LLGARQAVWYGGMVIAAGHFALAVPRIEFFFVGLLLLVIGTGLLKPNISAMVGQLYPEGGARRDAGFTIFYMGINLGAAIGPLICGTLGEKVNWHCGFGAAGVGMVLGLIQYRLSAPRLSEAGRPPGASDAARFKARCGLGVGLGLIALVTGLALARVIRIDPVGLAQGTTTLIVGIAVVYFLYLFMFAELTRTEKKRLVVVLVLFFGSALFWSGFEQAGSSLNLFADRYTARVVRGHELPASWFQVFNPLFIITLAPAVAATWMALARRGLNPSLPVKFALGLGLLSAGFLVMFGAAKLALSSHAVWPTWLITTYLLHSIGELCLSPVGLSSVTKLAPARMVGQMMGVWFLATSLGNLIAGLVAGELSGEFAHQMPARFLQIVVTTGAAAALLLLFAKPIRKMMAGAE
jgi:POT family proton-dependent oligopeptide transporter